MPHNMGSLYWQLDDCWPVASWSSVDYFGRWKALQYYARRFYSPVLVSPHAEGGNINFHIVSDKAEATPAELVVTLLDFDGHALSENRKTVEVAPLASKSYLSLPADGLLRGHDTKAIFLNCELLVGGKTVSSNRVFFRPFKELTLPVYLSAEGLDGSFSDNYFDLIPGKEVKVEFRVRRTVSPEEFRARLKARTLAEAFVGR
jgi:beta-mannosidase